MAQAQLTPFSRFLLWLVLVTLSCATPGARQPTLVPTAAPATQPTAVTRSAPTPIAAATSPVSTFSGEAVSGAADRLPPANPFAPFSAVAASTLDPGLQRDDLDDMQKHESLQQLSAEQQEALLANGFVVEPQPFSTFAAVYARGGEQKLPAFVTADAILHTSRLVADVAWQRSEARHLPADLQALSHAMVAVSQQQWEQAQDDGTTRAAQRNLAFFAVGSSLLDPDFAPPALVNQIVAEELTLIAQGGRFISPLFATEEDYGRFVPRGRYAQSEAMARYFRALSWFGRPLALSYMPEGTATVNRLVEARIAARQALLMTWGLEDSDNLSRWERIFQPSLYFHGATVAWSVPQVQAVAATLYGDDPSVSDLAGDALLDDFLATMHTMPPSLPFAPEPQPAFALLPVPDATYGAAPDSAILHSLTFNRIGAYSGGMPLPQSAVQTEIGLIRGLLRTLDVAAALGSPLAEEIVASGDDSSYEGYELQLENIQLHYAAIEPASWAASFDGGWLLALRPLLAEATQTGFLYAPPEAWQARQLASWHAAWISLRHETQLIPRPVAVEPVSPEVAYGYLEPQPLLYGRMASLVGQIIDGLGSRDLLDEESASKLRQLERLLDAARTISRKELSGQRLSTDEAQLLSQFITRLAALTTYEPASGATVAQTDPGPSRLVDVYQEPSSGRLLQAASGHVWPIYILVPRQEGVTLAMGAVLSSYELHGEQLSSGAWREMENRPPPPDWMQPHIVTD